MNRPQAVRLPRLVLIWSQVQRAHRARLMARAAVAAAMAEAMPRNAKDVAVFLACSVFWGLFLAVWGHVLGVLS